MRRAGVLALAFTLAALALPLRAPAQVASQADPKFHGQLFIGSAEGRIDRKERPGTATFTGHRWSLAIDLRVSNGIYPDQEPIIVSIGDTNQYYLPAGSMHARRKGKLFIYRAHPKPGDRAIRMLRIDRLKDAGVYRIAFTLRGLDLSRLLFEDPTCLATAIIIGDDDGFLKGISLSSPSFRSPKIRVPDQCDAGGWPWLQ